MEMCVHFRVERRHNDAKEKKKRYWNGWGGVSQTKTNDNFFFIYKEELV